MELFILIALQLLIEVQSYLNPNIKVSPDVAIESTSVYLTCQTPADVTVTQCYFYANGQNEINIKLSQSCQLILSGAEILVWTSETSPVTLDINCYYTTDVRGVHKPSDHSPPATLTILETLGKPFISVDDSTATISISCETPLKADVTCNLYTENERLRHSSSSPGAQSGKHYCMFNISQSDLFTHKQLRQLSCDYSPKTNPENEMNLTSPRSDVYTVRGFAQAKLTASSSVIMETDTVQLVCMNSENQKMDMCFFTVDVMQSNMKQTESCQLSLTGSDISHWSGGQRSSVIITCFYTVNISGVRVPSPQSDPVTVQISTSALTAHTTTTDTTTFSTSTITARTTTDTTTSVSQTTQDSATVYQDMWIIILSAVVCSGLVLTALICLCLFACKKKKTRCQGTAGHEHASAETYSLITSVSGTSQATGLKHPQSHQDSKPGPSDTYSLITSISQPSGLKHSQSHQDRKPGLSDTYSLITSTSQTSDALLNTQHEKGRTEESENVYHVYCTIPDKPVKAVTGDQI